MEKKKGRMGRVYTAPGVKAPESKIKAGGKETEKVGKHKAKTPKMGG